MNRCILLLTALCLFVSTGTIYAAPAAPLSFELAQPGGHRFMAATRGDEFGSWTETAGGHTILRRNRTWYYAERDGSAGIRPSAIAVGRMSQIELDAWPRGLRPEIHPDAFEVRNPQRVLRSTAGPESPQGVTQTQRVLVVLVHYDDISFTHSDASFQSLIFGATNSVKEFFLENSYGDFEIVPASESSGTTNDGIVHVARAVNHPDSGQSFALNNAEAKAIMPLTDGVVNYALFDDNGDGDITADELSIVMILAGYERSFGGDANAKSPSVWGHQSKFASFFPPIPGVLFPLDGKNLSLYTMFGEQHGTINPNLEHQATIGIMSHELGHLMFDLPDLYDSDSSSKGIGRWGLMGGGSWNFVGAFSGDSPAHLNAWSKTVLGFISPIDQITPQNGAMLDSAHATADAARLWIDPYGWREYFLLENRQLSGYDAGLPAAGILIWHIDESQTRNSNEARKWVDLEEADGLAQLDTNPGPGGDAGDPYPGSAANTLFNDGTDPNSKAYGDAATNISVSNISASSATMTADLTPRAGSMGDHISYSQRRPRISSGYGIGMTTAYAGLRVENTTSQNEFQGVDVYITDSVSATVEVRYYSSMTGGTPSGTPYSETGFAAVPGWNRLLLATPQLFPVSETRGIVLKIVNDSGTSVLSQDNSRQGSGRSYVDADGLGTFTQVCVGPGELCGDLNIVTLLGSATDNDPPTVTSIMASTVGPTNADSVSFDISFSETVVNFNDASDVIVNHSGTAHSGVNISGSGSSYTLQLTGISGDGSFTIELDPASDIEDSAGNALQASPISSAVEIDNTAPGIGISSPSVATTATGPVSFNISYTAADTVTLTNGNVALNSTGNASGTVGVSGSGNSSRTVTISSITGNGTLGISISSGTASDDAGNVAASAGPSATFTVNNVAPTADTITPNTSGPTNVDSVSFSVQFSESVVNFNNASDLLINHSGTAHSGLSISGSGAAYTVNVTGISGDGSFTLAVSTESDVQNNLGVALASSVTSGSIAIDNTPPGVSISMPSDSNTISGPVSYAITYSGASDVTLAAENVSLNQTGTANGTVGVSGAGISSRTVTISAISGEGTLGISIAAGTASDTAGNSAGAVGPSGVFTVGQAETIFSDSFESPP